MRLSFTGTVRGCRSLCWTSRGLSGVCWLVAQMLQQSWDVFGEGLPLLPVKSRCRQRSSSSAELPDKCHPCAQGRMESPAHRQTADSHGNPGTAAAPAQDSYPVTPCSAHPQAADTKAADEGGSELAASSTSHRASPCRFLSRCLFTNRIN